MIESMSPSIKAQEAVARSFCGMNKNKVVSFTKEQDFSKKMIKRVGRSRKWLMEKGLMENQDKIFGVLEDSGCDPQPHEVLCAINNGQSYIEIGKSLYKNIFDLSEREICVDTKYKTVDKKVRPAAIPLPLEAKELLDRARKESSLRAREKIGHKFTTKTLSELKIGGDGLLIEKEIIAF